MDVKEKVFSILKDISGIQDITESQSLQDELGLDSLAMVTLLVEIEENLDFELDESDMNPYDLLTVQDVIELVDKYYKILEK